MLLHLEEDGVLVEAGAHVRADRGHAVHVLAADRAEPLSHRPAGHGDQGDRLARTVLHDQVAQRLQVLPPGLGEAHDHVVLVVAGAVAARLRALHGGAHDAGHLRRGQPVHGGPLAVDVHRQLRAGLVEVALEAAELRRHGGASEDLQHAVGEVLEHPGILADDLDVHRRPLGRPVHRLVHRDLGAGDLAPDPLLHARQGLEAVEAALVVLGEVHHDARVVGSLGCRLSAGCLRRRRWSLPTRRPRSPGRRAPAALQLAGDAVEVLDAGAHRRLGIDPDLPGRDVLRERTRCRC